MDSSRLSLWIGIGMGIGVAFGAALDNIGLGVALGPSVGVMIWAVEAAHRESRGPDGDELDAGTGDSRDLE